MYLNAKHIVYKTIYGYLGIPDSGNEAQIMTSYFIGVPPPLQEEVGGKNQEWQDMTGQEMHTQSVTKITLRVCKYFLPHFFIL